MKAGNRQYLNPADIRNPVPVFPLSGALLLPGGQMPLNIFEPRYLAMIDDALGSQRVIAMVQPRFDAVQDSGAEPELCSVGCLGRITAFQETGDGRYLITLNGIARYRILEEVDGKNGYRRCNIDLLGADLEGKDDGAEVDREALLEAFRRYLDANGMEADWESVRKASNETLVTALSMMSPYGPAEKQALLEAEDIRSRAETLVAITEIALARSGGEHGGTLQ
ncbi:MAG: LON peptidase substrate-binding domain-containing protein [Rhizobiaceae bacterium]